MQSIWAHAAADAEPHFSEAIAARGRQYLLNSRVRIRTVDAAQCTAVVQGTQPYDVKIRLAPSPDDFRYSCTCPAALRAPCKHMFATLLEVEQQARDMADLTAREPRRTGGEAATPPPRRPSIPEWERQLQRLGPPPIRDPWSTVEGATTRPLMVLCEDSPEPWSQAHLRVMVRRLLRSGEFSIPKDLPQTGNLPRFDAEGARLYASLMGLGLDANGQPNRPSNSWDRVDQFILQGRTAPEVLTELARNGVLHLGRTTGRPEEEPLTFDEDGPFRFVLRLDVEQKTGAVLNADFVRGTRRIPLKEPRLLLACDRMVHAGALVEVDYGGACEWADGLRRTGPIHVPIEAYPTLVQRLLDHGAPLPLEGPIPGPRPAAEPVPPQGALHLFTVDAVYGGALDRDAPAQGPVTGTVEFHYGKAWVDAIDPTHSCIDPETGELIPRDFETERALLARLLELGATPTRQDDVHTTELPRRQAIRIATTLRREGWQVTTDGQTWSDPDSLSVRVSTGIDWFDVEGDVQFGEEVIALPEILRALRENQGTIELKDGSRGILPDDMADRLGLVVDLSSGKQGALRFEKNQGWVLDALLAELDEDYTADSKFSKIRQRARSFDGIKPRQPSSQFKGELRPYQCDALGWLRFLQTMELGGCLADDMGLGKTVMVLAHLLHHRRATKPTDRKPALVVAPKSLVWNWITEAQRFAPALKVLDFSGPASQRSPAAIADYDVAVTTYGVLRRDADALRDIAFSYVILDEAQAIKNPASQAWKAARVLQADHRLALTGTPVENHLGDLWAIMDFLNPGMLGRRTTHRDWARIASVERREHIARIVRPVMLRRTKEEVLQDLPPRQETLLHCEMGPKQARCYNELRDHYRTLLLNRIETEGIARSKMHVLEALLRLRQAACHPGLLDGERTEQPSAKFDALLPRLEEVAEAGSKALVFSQFTSLLAILKERLDAEGITYAYLDGKSRQRNRIVERFQEDAGISLFLISLKAGGVGLNLTAADHVFLLDPWWNPAVERQAVDRAHRIGQTNVVNVYRLVTAETVEEHILELQDRKRELADAILGDGSGVLRGLTREDLEALLGG